MDEVSLAVEAGSFVALVGPSGCGKSTLLNIAAGLLTPTSGCVRVEGQEFLGVNPRATYMFQQDALLPWKNVRDNVALGLILANAPVREAHVQADAWIARVGLGGFETHYPSQLSGGMRKRVAMAQNWILARSQVLMDEPFSALDVHTRQSMESELLTLWNTEGDSGGAEAVTVGAERARRRRTVLFVTHDLREAIALADEVVVLSAGPASWIVARHEVDLARPRDLLELQTAKEFTGLYQTLWSVLREEVKKSQRAGPRRG